MSDLLRSLRGNERLWANRSGRSPKMSEWVNRSIFLSKSHSLIFEQKTSDSLGKLMSEFPALACLHGLIMGWYKKHFSFLFWNICWILKTCQLKDYDIFHVSDKRRQSTVVNHPSTVYYSWNISELTFVSIDLTEQPKKLSCGGENPTTDCSVYLATHMCTTKVKHPFSSA